MFVSTYWQFFDLSSFHLHFLTDSSSRKIDIINIILTVIHRTLTACCQTFVQRNWIMCPLMLIASITNWYRKFLSPLLSNLYRATSSPKIMGKITNTSVSNSCWWMRGKKWWNFLLFSSLLIKHPSTFFSPPIHTKSEFLYAQRMLHVSILHNTWVNKVTIGKRKLFSKRRKSIQIFTTKNTNSNSNHLDHRNLL